MPRRLPLPLAALALAASLTALPSTAVPPEARGDKKPASATDAEQAAGRAAVEKGLTVSLWAAEPLLANPVSFAFDEHGTCYVAETYRHTDGVTDTRGHMY